MKRYKIHPATLATALLSALVEDYSQASRDRNDDDASEFLRLSCEVEAWRDGFYDGYAIV